VTQPTTKDPITAQGLSDAFIDAEALATALDDGWSGRRQLAEALAANQTTRDRRVEPMYEFPSQLATLEPPAPLMQRLFLALHDNHEATNQFFSAITGSRSLPEFMSLENLDRIMASTGIEAGD
jgi:2-polyprenyl-6-methoxyphenol hydroxylase-like FAD-dependent oxidoreductase